jgi:mannose-6-phosphate isomerase-like protein (cupin superfamily)
MPNRGFVLGPDEGEHLIRSAAQAATQGDTSARAGGGSIFIKVDPRRGSANVSLGTQHLPPATGIRVHRHFESDEILFVLDGTGFGILDDVRLPLEKGSCMYIPTGAWHGIENPETGLWLLWVITPPGLEQLLREIASPVGSPPRQLTLEQLNAIADRHGQEFR